MKELADACRREGLYAGDDGSVELASAAAQVHIEDPYSHMEVKSGITELWTSEKDFLTWEFETDEDGVYHMQLVWDSRGFWGIEDLGHEFEISVDDTVYACQVTDAWEEIQGVRHIAAGKVQLPSGTHKVKLAAGKIIMKQLMGLRVRGLFLKKQQQGEDND